MSAAQESAGYAANPPSNKDYLRLKWPTATSSAMRKSAAPVPSSYVVQRGDNLSSLSRRFNIPVSEIARINGITDVNRIREGQRLSLVQPVAPRPAARTKAPEPIPNAVKGRSVPALNIVPSGYDRPTAPLANRIKGDAVVAGTGDSGVPELSSVVANGVSARIRSLFNNREFQRRVGQGSAWAGSSLLNYTVGGIGTIPMVNEAAGSAPTGARAAALSYTMPGTGESYIAVPSRSLSDRRPSSNGYGTAGQLYTTHEVNHIWSNKLPGYLDLIRKIQGEEGVTTTPDDRYTHSASEHAAQFNALRMLRGAYPGQGAGPGGAYTPEQAEDVFKNDQYFSDTPLNYKMRLLNEARNVRPGSVPATYKMAAAKVDIPDIFSKVKKNYGQMGIDVGHMGLSVSRTPTYKDGSPMPPSVMPPNASAGNWQSNGVVRINPEYRRVMNHYGIKGKGRDFIARTASRCLGQEAFGNIPGLNSGNPFNTQAMAAQSAMNMAAGIGDTK